MPPSNTTTKALLGAAGLVLVAGAALAVVQPGDLGDDEATEGAQGQEATTTTVEVDDTTGEPITTTVDVITTTTADPDGTTTTAVPVPTTSTTVPPATATTASAAGVTTTTIAPIPTTTATTAAPDATTTTLPGSGLGNGGASVADGSTATTGMESLLGPGLGLAAVAYAARAAARRRPAR